MTSEFGAMSKTSLKAVSLYVSVCRRPWPSTPMPQTHPRDTRPDRAPVALFLQPTHTHRPTGLARRALPDWYGVHPHHVAHLIARYTRDADTVLDTDAHPSVATAAEHLHRRPGVAITAGEHPQGSLEPIDRHTAAARRGAGLVLATLPRLDIDTRDVHALSRALGTWRAQLRPGGFLIILLTAGPGTAALGHRSTVIAAARTAGLLYHQHVPALLIPLPKTEPRTESTVALHPPLHGGRHVRAHRDLLAFASMTPETTDA